jgi:hypothetical protein
MAIVKANLFTQGTSGMVGKTMVFRVSGGKTYLSAAPTVSEHEPTPEQAIIRQKFQEAVIYAKCAIKNSETKAAYQEMAEKRQKRSAYVVAVADFFKAPDIREIDLSQYTGARGSRISVKITDDFKVKLVGLDLYHSDGTLLETGKAVQSEDEVTWIYTAASDNNLVNQTRIVVKAYDLPGNLTEKEESLIVNN